MGECISRRLFILCFSCLLSVLCIIQFVEWVAASHLFDTFIGIAWKPAHEHCIGSHCYEVFSCFGLKDATQHVREPLASVTGLVFLPLGAHAAHHGLGGQMRLLSAYLAVSAVVHVGLVFSDVIYFSACSAYPVNSVHQTLLSEVLPPSPVGPAVVHALREMPYYPAAEVGRLTAGFPVLAWYLAWAGLYAALLAYAAHEARLLGDLLERGPLGLGVHYGLGRWDEVIDHDAVRRHKEREVRSRFFDDAQLPAAAAPADIEAPSLGHRAQTAWRGYGAVLDGLSTPPE